MKVYAIVVVAALAASSAAAQPPPRELFENAPVTMTAEIVRVDMSSPTSKLHVRDTAGGKTWVVEGASSNTLRRGGALSEDSRGTVTVVGYPAKDGACTPECRMRLRELTFPNGRKVFLGATGPS